MKIFYQNVNRIKSKLKQLYINILNDNYDIICLSETNLDSSFSDSEFVDERYVVFRRDRETTMSLKKSGGGVLIALRRDLTAVRRPELESNLEDLWVTVHSGAVSRMHSLNIYLVYLPPDLGASHYEYFHDHCHNTLLNHNNDYNTIVLGDFNIPGLIWTYDENNLPRLKPSRPYDIKSTLVTNLMELNGLSQYNHIHNANGRTLDLVMTDFSELVVTECTPLSTPDRHHPSIEIFVNIARSKNMKTKTARLPNYRKCDTSKCIEQLNSTDWTQVLNHTDVDLDVESFYEILNGIINKNTPLKNVGLTDYPVWFSESLKSCINEKNNVHKRFKRFGNPRDYDEFRLLRSRSKKLIKECYDSYITSVEESLSDSTKLFFSYIKSKRSNPSIPDTVKFGSRTVTGGQAAAELFSEFFSSVFESDAGTCDPRVEESGLGYSLSLVHVTVDEVHDKLLALSPNKGAGPDGIPPSFIKQCASALSPPLCMIYNKSLQMGEFPSIWKVAHIVPIHKAGDSSDCANYRPISMLSCFSKVLESLIYEHLYHHVKPLLHQEQHGFVAGKSTVSNLLEYTNYICKAFNDHGQVDSIYTDFQKAFDRVNHRVLLLKLKAVGIHGSLLRWLESYITNRSQLVALKGYLSKPASIVSGVPQGSHLGPLLFILFINDLIPKFQNTPLLYADDLKIFRRIESVRDCIQLQIDIDTLLDWCADNGMSLSIKKCSIISFTRKRNPIVFNYAMDSVPLERKSVIRDLGVLFDDKLSFNCHFEMLSKKCNKLTGFICRASKEFKCPSSLLTLYKSLVLSQLEYASVIWAPQYNTYIDMLESTQRRLVRILTFRSGLKRELTTYEDRLRFFKLKTLECRRKIQDLVYLHKIISGSIASQILSEISLGVPSRSSRRGCVFSIPLCNNNVSFHNPVLRMCREYNTLVSQSRDVPDIYGSSLGKWKFALFKSIKI